MSPALKVVPIEQGKKKASSFAEALRSTATTEPAKKKKPTMPILTPTAEVDKAIEAFNKAKEKKKRAEAEMSKNQATIINWVKEHQDEDGFKGDFHGSYLVQGKEEKITFVTSDVFSVNASDEKEIRKILGEHYDDLIDEDFTLTVKQEVFDNEELQAEFMGLLGDRWTDFLDNRMKLITVNGFNEKIYRVIKRENLQALRLFVRPKAPSLR